MARTFEGKVVLVTGGGSGIGEATALAFGQAGAKVVVADLDRARGNRTVRRISEAGGEALALEVDVSAADEVAQMVDEVVRAYGRLDCACNGAGVEGTRAPTADYPEDDWDQVMDVDLRGVWLCMKYEIRAMRKRGGAIVNLASIFGTRGFPEAPAYVSAKHGVIGLTKSAALEQAARGIRINAVCPSFINTPMQMRTGALIYPEQLNEVVAAHPMGRFGEPEEVAEAVLWLASDAASFVTGHALIVDGGYTAR